LIVLVVYGAIARGTAQHAVLVGSSGIRSIATVEARYPDGEWQRCGFSAATGSYRCADLLYVSDATTNLLNDAPPSWAFITPAIAAYADRNEVEVRITRTLRLGGRYWLGSSSGKVTLLLDETSYEFEAKTMLEIPRGEHTIQLTGTVPADGSLNIVFVREDTLVPERQFLAPPPALPPASVTSIR
jgi:hypothetical protein